MSEVSVVVEMNASADAVWNIVGNPAEISAWHPAIKESKATNNGKSRTCVLEHGDVITESILDHDPARRSYRYAIDGGPLPVADYVSTITVEPVGEQCRVLWSASFISQVDSKETEEMVKGIYEQGLNAVKLAVEAA